MLVSCIMPTRGRPGLAQNALACFLDQTYGDRELVIIDDAAVPSFPAPPQMKDVHYHRLAQRLSIGAKRNLACGRATGDVICHWDDDDWSAAERIESQVRRLTTANAQVTGYHTMLFREGGGKMWRYRGRPTYALGTSLMYTREFWRANPFPDESVGEDTAFIAKAARIVSVDAAGMMVASIHPGNTASNQHMDAACWSEVA